MGYALHIKRANKDNKITVQEWTNYIGNAPDFKKTDELSLTNPENGMTMKIGSPNCGIWKPNENMEVPFTYSDNRGSISVKNPDDIVLRKMIEISKQLNAQVFGEEGEEITESSLSKWWQFWK